MFTMENAQVEVHQTGDGGHHGEQRSIEKSLAVGDRPGSRGEEINNTTGGIGPTGTVLRRHKRQEAEANSKKKEASVRRNSSGYYSNTSDQDKTAANEQEKSNGVGQQGGKNLKSVRSKVDTGLGGKKLGPQNRNSVGQKKSEPLLPSQFDRRASRDGLFKVPEPPASNFNRYAQNRRSLTNLFTKNTNTNEKSLKYGGRPSNKSKSKESTPDNTEEKRNNFLNRRSMTSLSLFGSSKKQTEPTTTSATKEKKSSLSRLRSARSSLDLSSIGFGSLSRSQSKVALGDLKEEDIVLTKSDQPTSSTRKFSTDRPWFDLERLWKDRAKDLPAEDMFNNLRRRERVVRSESRDSTSDKINNGSDFLDTTPPTSTQLTPATLKKTVNLLSPEMLTNWYEKKKSLWSSSK